MYLAIQDNDYIKVARHSWDVLWVYVNTPETDWKLESDSVEANGVIHSRRIKGIGKVYRLKVRGDLLEILLHLFLLKPD